MAVAESSDAGPPPVARPTGVDGPAARRIVHWLSLLAITAIVFYLCWRIIAPFIDLLMWAAVLAIVFRPAYLRLAARLRSPSVAAAVSCLIIIVTILLPVTLITIMIARDATRLAAHLQANKAELLDPQADTVVGRALRYVDRFSDVDRAASQKYLSERMAQLSGTLARGTLNLVGGVVGAVIEMVLILFALFFLFRDGTYLWSATRELIPLERDDLRDVVKRTKDVIWACIYGSVVIAIVQGTLGGLAFWVLDVPSPLLWGAVMALVCLIPMAGSFLIWVPVALYLLAIGRPGAALALTAWSTLVIGTIDNLLRPVLVGNRTHLHELVIFFSVLGGLHVFGMLGIVAGPVTAALAMALVDIWRRMTAPTPTLKPA